MQRQSFVMVGSRRRYSNNRFGGEVKRQYKWEGQSVERSMRRAGQGEIVGDIENPRLHRLLSMVRRVS